MRLLNVQTRRLEWFNSSSDVTYAILSHVWDREEILYEDIIRDDSASMQKKHGFAKFANACKLAARQGHQYLWNDTCCIDKSSSAELSEAINSMFRYYEDSLVCFAYLEDVLGPSLDSFPKSKWFTRSWTLQETVAPTRVEFYDRDWNYLGSKEHLAPTIASITLIDEDVLLQSARGTDALNDKSIAKRMSWAANRQATREEDVAYSLLGIFDVSMPLLYGEGIIKAFNRLQIEIMKDSPDMSILAWTRESTTNQSGVLAVHPGDFRGAANVIPIPRLQEPFAVTNNVIGTPVA
ncbi:HET-domain-containing protein [Polyplosphaeria fusca]|uniref:HET-domain-containing protein n=1 Tax=Polyplosphaeria fusca TaxID=682080 RepID=A0A9P4V2J0_9PLEO|nr:HET-domain-containing protein [Polyplosphaeria fusca]